MIFPPAPDNQQMVSRSSYCEETQQLQDGIAENQVKTEDLENKFEILKEQNHDLKRQLRNQRSQFLHQQKLMEEYVESLADTQGEQARWLMEDKRQLNTKIQGLESAYQDQQKKIHGVENQVTEAFAKLHKEDAYHRQKFIELQNELATLQDVEMRVGQHEKLMQKVEDEVNQHTLHIPGVKQQVVALQDETEAVHEILRTHESKINSLATGFKEMMRIMEQKMLGWVVNHQPTKKK